MTATAKSTFSFRPFTGIDYDSLISMAVSNKTQPKLNRDPIQRKISIGPASAATEKLSDIIDVKNNTQSSEMRAHLKDAYQRSMRESFVRYITLDGSAAIDASELAASRSLGRSSLIGGLPTFNSPVGFAPAIVGFWDQWAELSRREVRLQPILPANDTKVYDVDQIDQSGGLLKISASTLLALSEAVAAAETERDELQLLANFRILSIDDQVIIRETISEIVYNAFSRIASAAYVGGQRESIEIGKSGSFSRSFQLTILRMLPISPDRSHDFFSNLYKDCMIYLNDRPFIKAPWGSVRNVDVSLLLDPVPDVQRFFDQL